MINPIHPITPIDKRIGPIRPIGPIGPSENNQALIMQCRVPVLFRNRPFHGFRQISDKYQSRAHAEIMI